MDKTARAQALFSSGKHNCGQAVFLAFCEDFGIDRDLAAKLTSSFGGGLASENVCGAVLGAHLLLGLKYGYVEKAPDITKKIHEKSIEFQHRFQGLFGSLICSELKATGRPCDLFVEGAAKLLENEFGL